MGVHLELVLALIYPNPSPMQLPAVAITTLFIFGVIISMARVASMLSHIPMTVMSMLHILHVHALVQYITADLS